VSYEPPAIRPTNRLYASEVKSANPLEISPFAHHFLTAEPKELNNNAIYDVPEIVKRKSYDTTRSIYLKGASRTLIFNDNEEYFKSLAL
jgi:hypothetical protein